MRRSLIFLAAPLLVLFLVSSAFAPTDPIPHMINYQGMLTDNMDQPINDNLDLTFRIFDAATNGNQEWTETQNDVPIVSGLFNVVLGSVNPINLPFDEFYWLEIEIEGGEVVTPRIQLTSMGYAYMAETAVTDGDWTISGNDMYSSVSGNVGIGVPSPTEKLDVNGTIKMTGFEMPTGASAGYILTTNGTGVGTWQPAPSGGIGGSGTDHYIPVFTSSSSIGNSGIYQSGSRIGIGSTSPGAGLEVSAGGDLYNPSIGIKNTDGNMDWRFVVEDDDDFKLVKVTGTTFSALTVQPGGNVGIGNTSPSEKLEVNGNIELSGIIKGRVPGVDYSNASGLGTQTRLNSSWLTLKSVSITHPGTGYVVCIGTGHVDWDDPTYTDNILAGWTTSSTGTPISYNRVSLPDPDGTTYIPLTAIHTFTVSGSGTTTFYFRAKLDYSDEVDFFEGSVAAMYFPTLY